MQAKGNSSDVLSVDQNSTNTSTMSSLDAPSTNNSMDLHRVSPDLGLIATSRASASVQSCSVPVEDSYV